VTPGVTTGSSLRDPRLRRLEAAPHLLSLAKYSVAYALTPVGWYQ